MEIYLRSDNGYFVTGGNQEDSRVMANEPVAAYRSLLRIENMDPARNEPTEDQTIRSHNHVALSNRWGCILTADDPTLNEDLICDVGANYARRGHEIFQITKVNGNRGDLIVHGDRVRFQLTSPIPDVESDFRIVDNDTHVSVLNAETEPFGITDFDFLVPTDISELLMDETAIVPYEGATKVPGLVRVAGGPGVGLPGGTGFTVDVRDTEFIQADSQPLRIVPHGQSEGSFDLIIPGHLGRFSPCSDQRTATIRVSAFASDTVLERTLTLRPGHISYIGMQMVSFQGGGCLVPGLVGILPWVASFYSVQAELVVESPFSRERNQSVEVRISSDDSRITNVFQLSNTVSESSPLGFSFSIKRADSDGNEFCALLKAEFTVNGVNYSPTFAVLSQRYSVVLDPH